MNIALPIVLFFLLGILLYYIDMKVGVGIYRWWYKLTHKEPLPEEIKKGFIAGASFGSRLFIAIIFIVAEVLLSFQLGNAPPFLDILMGFLGLIGLMLGFYLAGHFMKAVPGGVKKTADYIEKIESGEADIKKEIAKGILKAGAAIKEGSEQLKETLKESAEEIKKDKSEEVEEESNIKEEKPDEEKLDEEDPENWRDGVDDFLNK